MYEWDTPRTWSERVCGWLPWVLIVVCLALIVWSSGCLYVEKLEIKVLDGVKTDVQFKPFAPASQPTSQPSDDDQIVPLHRSSP